MSDDDGLLPQPSTPRRRCPRVDAVQIGIAPVAPQERDRCRRSISSRPDGDVGATLGRRPEAASRPPGSTATVGSTAGGARAPTVAHDRGGRHR